MRDIMNIKIMYMFGVVRSESSSTSFPVTGIIKEKWVYFHSGSHNWHTWQTWVLHCYQDSGWRTTCGYVLKSKVLWFIIRRSLLGIYLLPREEASQEVACKQKSQAGKRKEQQPALAQLSSCIATELPANFSPAERKMAGMFVGVNLQQRSKKRKERESWVCCRSDGSRQLSSLSGAMITSLSLYPNS